MKKIISIVLVMIFMMSSTETYQLCKIPQLFIHYTEHHNSNNDLSFSEFFCMHYSSVDDHDADIEKDMKLPFKSHDNCSHIMLSIPHSDINQSLFIPTKEHSLLILRMKQSTAYSADLPSIWQPPKSSV